MEETNWNAQKYMGGQVKGFGETGQSGVDWVHLVQDMDNWQARKHNDESPSSIKLGNCLSN